jgi:hypothetical protein
MKMVKSLLLGSAAGLVAVAGAQAADLPVKAKAVEYVKVCSLYGAGFYYIPGTDTCIKIGGFVRTEWLHNAGGSFGPNVGGADGTYTRANKDRVNRSRFITSFDVRSQTEYGTLRAYARAGWQWTTQDFQVGGSQCASAVTATAVPSAGSSSCTYLDRAFIQFAGFTFGKTQSFFDFDTITPYSLQTNLISGSTGGSGTPVFAYTWQLGNGVTATLSFEDNSEQRLGPVNVSAATGLAGGGSSATIWNMNGAEASLPAGNHVPDIVGNLRVDQAWGSAQVSGALHAVRASYYSTPSPTSAHPDDEWGWAVMAGITLKMPWNAKDTLNLATQYCEGAARYCSNPSGGVLGGGFIAGLRRADSGGIAVAWVTDGYFAAGTVGSQIDLSNMWNVTGAFEHYWTPTLRQSIHGQYASYEANSTQLDTVCVANAMARGCADWSAWQAGSRVLWNPVSNLDIGLEVLYTHINTALAGATYTGLTTNGLPTSLQTKDENVWSAVLRFQRNFWP